MLHIPATTWMIFFLLPKSSLKYIASETRCHNTINSSMQTIRKRYIFMMKNVDEENSLIQQFNKTVDNIASPALAFDIHNSMTSFHRRIFFFGFHFKNVQEIFGRHIFMMPQCIIPRFDGLTPTQKFIDFVDNSNKKNWIRDSQYHPPYRGLKSLNITFFALMWRFWSPWPDFCHFGRIIYYQLLFLYY